MSNVTAVGYARRSTELQERSIPDQQAYVEKWAKEHGYAVKRWYIDDAISGTSTRGRDEFERMIAEAENGRDFDAIMCYDMSRFSRGGTNETGFYLHRLKLVGVEAVFCAEGIPEGDEGELLQGVKSWQARQYSVKLSRDSIRGQHSTVTIRHSAMGGRAPYGYDRQYLSAGGQLLKTVRTLSDGRREEFGPDAQHLRFLAATERTGRKVKSDIVRLVPGDQEHVHVVKLIFDMCVRGYGFRSIVIELNRRGIPGPIESEWNRMAVKTVLQNPTYRGALVWNRRTFGKIHAVAADGSPRRKKPTEGTRNPKYRWIVVENVHEPLVSPDLFAKAQAAMEERRGKGGLARPTKRYLLSGLMRCTHCGFNFHGAIVKNSTGEIRYYTDGGYRARGISVCRSTSIPAGPLDAWVMRKLQETVLSNGEGEIAVDAFVRGVLEGQTKQAEVPPAVDGELAAINKRIKATVAMLTDPELGSVDELKQTLLDLKRKQESLVAQRDSVQAAKKGQADETSLRAWARSKFTDLESAIRTSDATWESRQIIQSYIDRIEIDPETKRGTLYMPADAVSCLDREAIRLGSHSSLLIHPFIHP